MLALSLVAALGGSPKGLWERAQSPPTIHRPVPLWWWDGERLDLQRLLWELDQIRRQGVLQVCIIYQDPLGAEPRYFSEEWWQALRSVIEAARERGMKVWLYDQIGFGGLGYHVRRAVSENPAWSGRRLAWAVSPPLSAGQSWSWEVPKEAELISALAVPLSGLYRPERCVNLTRLGKQGSWRAPEGREKWRVYVFYAVQDWRMDFLNPGASGRLIDLVHGEFSRRLGRYLGKVVVGTFQDELMLWHFPPWSPLLPGEFRRQKGYDIADRLPLLLPSSDPQRIKVRCDYWDVVVSMVEKSFFKPFFRWHERHGLLSSHDQLGRRSLQGQLRFYGDYMRTMRWFTAPGYDDFGPPGPGRNWRDAKMASSLARLYRRPLVWLEAYHSSGWGLSLDDCHTMTAENFLYGATLFDLHGFYYTTYGGWWEWAPPSGLFRQPYFAHYKPFSDWVTKAGFLLSQGESVATVAVLYPIATIQAHTALDETVEPKAAGCEDLFWRLSRATLDAGYDFDFVDEDSIRRGVLRRRYKALVLPGATVARRSTLWRVLEFVRHGGALIAVGTLPTATVEGGEDDWVPRLCWKETFGKIPPGRAMRRFEEGMAVFLPKGDVVEFVKVLESLVPRDFVSPSPAVRAVHRRAGGVDIFFVANLSDEPVEGRFEFEAEGFPQLWDLERGRRFALPFERKGEGRVEVPLRLNERQTVFVVFGPEREEGLPLYRPSRVVSERRLDGWWEFKVDPTLDNRWGDFRLPASPEKLGPEARRFRYRAEPEGIDSEREGWWRQEFDDSGWEEVTYSVGQLWWVSPPLPFSAEDEGALTLERPPRGGRWRPYAFSKVFGVEKDPIHRRTLGPKKFVPDEFLLLGKARPGTVRYCLTFVYAPRPMEAVLVARSNGPFCVRLDGRKVVDKGEAGGAAVPVRLDRGWHKLLARLAHGDEPLRAYVHILPPEEATPFWIWYPERPTEVATRFFRREFTLPERPRRAWLVITADNGYEVFVNGKLVGKELGYDPIFWKYAERFEVTRLLRKGRNVLAVKATNLGGPAGLLALLVAVLPSGRKARVATGPSWRCSRSKEKGWTEPEFDDSRWERAISLGSPSVQPWGRIAGFDEPLPGEPPRLRWFTRPSPLLFDPLPFARKRVGWFRFVLPPGARAMRLRVEGRAKVWAGGKFLGKVEGRGRVELGNLARKEGTVCALKVEMRPGVWGGAAILEPIKVEAGWGLITLGDWRWKGLRCYSGMGVYKKRFVLPKGWEKGRVFLDLGEVRATAEVWVNGSRVGVRAWRPYRFDLSGFVKRGENELIVKVANTLANHYAVALPSPYVYKDSDRAGLLGPVRLILAE